MKVKVRAVIPVGERIVVAAEPRRGRVHLTLPGGRPDRGESLQQTVVRETAEETGLDVEVRRLLYVAQVVAGATVQELTVVFLAEPVGEVPDSVVLVSRGDEKAREVLPPILDRVFDDLDGGWAPGEAFLDNIHVPRSRGAG